MLTSRVQQERPAVHSAPLLRKLEEKQTHSREDDNFLKNSDNCEYFTIIKAFTFRLRLV